MGSGTPDDIIIAYYYRVRTAVSTATRRVPVRAVPALGGPARQSVIRGRRTRRYRVIDRRPL